MSPYFIVIGNEKGGTGKSTISMHIIVQLLQLGYKVGSIDIDARQGTLTRYLENRYRNNEQNGKKFLMPSHHPILKSPHISAEAAKTEDRKNFEDVISKLSGCDFIVIDTPGNDTYLSRLAHSYADTIITPINDSFVDLDVLVRLESANDNRMRPSIYAATIWDQKKERLTRDKKEIDWIVVRNRLSHLSNKNNIEMKNVLDKLSPRLGFRQVPGFSERVIFKELFLSGITLLDLEMEGIRMSLSHVAARQELRDLIKSLKLPQLSDRLSNYNSNYNNEMGSKVGGNSA